MSKQLYKVGFTSNEFLDGATYALIEFTPETAKRLLMLRDSATSFLTGIIAEHKGHYLGARVGVYFPGNVELFDDDDDTKAETTLGDRYFLPVDDEWDVGVDMFHQAHYDQAVVRIDEDGDLWLECRFDGGDWVEVSLDGASIETIACHETNPLPT